MKPPDLPRAPRPWLLSWPGLALSSGTQRSTARFGGASRPVAPDAFQRLRRASWDVEPSGSALPATR